MLKTPGRSFAHLGRNPKNLHTAIIGRSLAPIARRPRRPRPTHSVNQLQIMPSIRQTILEHVNNANYQPVNPEATLLAESQDADVYIPGNKSGDAASGDIVSVRLDSKRGRMGKHEGEIIDVIERATNRFVGVYSEQAAMGLVQIDGKIFAN